MKDVIGNHAGRQFTPADPVVIIGMMRSDFSTKTTPIDVTIEFGPDYETSGARVGVKADPESNIELMEAMDKMVFREQVLIGLESIAAETSRE
jgi:hypothetical protein